MFRLVVLLLALIPAQVMAHVSKVAHDEPEWTFAPSIVVPVGLALILFTAGALRLWRRSSHGRDRLRRRATWFAAGWITLTAAAISPLHEAGELSFSLHMLEHELLMLVAAPFLVLAAPLEMMLWAFCSRTRHALAAIIRTPAVDAVWDLLRSTGFATVAQAAVLWIWHAPRLFQLALQQEGWHILQHLSFMVSALLFWSAVLRHRTGPAAATAAVCLFITSMVGGALGALMALAASPWYPAYAALGLTPFGLTPQEDQQLAGLLMWIPGGLVHAGAALMLLSRLMRAPSEPLSRPAPSGP